MGDTIEICDPGEHVCWSIYGFHAEAREWQIVHDTIWGGIGEAAARIVDLTGELVEYRDLSHAYADTRLPDLVDLLAQRIADEAVDGDTAHPLTELCDAIRAALDLRRG